MIPQSTTGLMPQQRSIGLMLQSTTASMPQQMSMGMIPQSTTVVHGLEAPRSTTGRLSIASARIDDDKIVNGLD
jgi:hypothetical protein